MVQVVQHKSPGHGKNQAQQGGEHQHHATLRRHDDIAFERWLEDIDEVHLAEFTAGDDPGLEQVALKLLVGFLRRVVLALEPHQLEFAVGNGVHRAHVRPQARLEIGRQALPLFVVDQLFSQTQLLFQLEDVDLHLVLHLGAVGHTDHARQLVARRSVLRGSLSRQRGRHYVVALLEPEQGVLGFLERLASAGKLLRQIFLDATGAIDDLAVVIGGMRIQDRVQDDHGLVRVLGAEGHAYRLGVGQGECLDVVLDRADRGGFGAPGFGPLLDSQHTTQPALHVTDEHLDPLDPADDPDLGELGTARRFGDDAVADVDVALGVKGGKLLEVACRRCVTQRFGQEAAVEDDHRLRLVVGGNQVIDSERGTADAGEEDQQDTHPVPKQDGEDFALRDQQIV